MDTMKIFSVRIDSIKVDNKQAYEFLEFEPAEVMKRVQDILYADNLEMVQSGVQFALRDGYLYVYGQVYTIDADTPKTQIVS
jgi:hypothetical protein